MTAEGGGMIPPDQTPRDALANMVMEFRGMRDQYPDGWTVYPEEFGSWSSRLERACQQLDAEQSPPDGPWGIVGTPDAPGICYVTDSPLIARLGPLIEAEAIAVRDALNRLGAVSPTAPPAEQDTPSLPAPEDRPQ